MSLTLNTNITSLQTQQYLGINTTSASQALNQLASGNRLNGPADDPAGYAIAFKLGVKSASLATSINNGNQALAMLQVVQGGIQQIGNILTQLKQIATEAASSNTDMTTLPALQTQVTQLETEINNIAASTQYGGTQVLMGGNTYTQTIAESQAGITSFNVSSAVSASYSLGIEAAATGTGVTLTMTNALGTNVQKIYITQPTPGTNTTVNFTNFGISLQVNGAVTTLAMEDVFVQAGTGSFTYQVGSEAETYNQISVSIQNFQFGNANGLKLVGDVNSKENAALFMGVIDAATTWITGQAGSIGASQNEIAYQVSNLTNMNTNTQSAASTIKDTDYAASMSNFTKFQVATQAGVAMLSQANQIPQMILSLIKG